MITVQVPVCGSGVWPGGQSTGLVRQREERRAGSVENASSRSMASWIKAAELPRFDPSAMKTDGSRSERSVQSEDMLHIVQPGRLLHDP